MATKKMTALVGFLVFQIYAAVAVGAALEASLDTAAYEAELDRLAQGFKALRAGHAPAAERAFAAVASALKGHVASGAPPPPPHASRDGKPYRPRARQSECAFNLANALLAQSKIDRAEVELRFALDPKGGLSPSVRAMSYYFLCDIALRRGRPRDAMRMMRRGLAEDSSEDVRGRFQGLVASAQARYAKRAASEPGVFEIQRGAGLFAFAAGQRRESVRAYERARALRPGTREPRHAHVWVHLAHWARDAGDLARAAALLNHALRVFWPHAVATAAAAPASPHVPNSDADSAADADADAVAALLELAAVEQLRGRFKPARRALRKLAAFAPRNRAGALALVKLLRRDMHDEKAAVAAATAAAARGALASPQQLAPHWVDGLASRAFHDASTLRIAPLLLDAFAALRAEAVEIVRSGALLKEAVWDTEGLVAADGVGGAAGGWCELNLFHMGRTFEKNLIVAPILATLLATRAPEAVSHIRGAAKLSYMKPRTHVRPHSGPSNTRLRVHLPLIVPTVGLSALRVGDETRLLKEGELIAFDDSFTHEVWHNGSEPRVVLIVDVWHPDMDERARQSCLTPPERERYLYHRDRCMRGRALLGRASGPGGAVCAGWFETSRLAGGGGADEGQRSEL